MSVIREINALKILALRGVIQRSRDGELREQKCSGKNGELLRFFTEQGDQIVTWQQLAEAFGETLTPHFKKRLEKRISELRRILLNIGSHLEIQSRYSEGFQLNLRTESLRRPVTINALIVDDNPVSREFLTAALSSLRISIDTASDGLKALVKCRSTEYAFILMDGQMPHMDGFDTTIELRTYPELYGRPTIVGILGDTGEDTHQRALTAGMNEILPKPIKPLALKQLAQRIIDTYQAPNDRILQMLRELDPQYLEELREQGDGQEFLLELFSIYLIHSEPTFKTMLKAQDWTIMKQCAHKLKGMAYNIGHYQLARRLQTIEDWKANTALSDSKIVNALIDAEAHHRGIVADLERFINTFTTKKTA